MPNSLGALEPCYSTPGPGCRLLWEILRVARWEPLRLPFSRRSTVERGGSFFSVAYSLSGLLNVRILKFFSRKKMGTVDVERYTGPCLITTAVRPKAKNKSADPDARLPANDPRNWAGAPLLSMAASIRKPKSGQKNWPPPVFLPTVIHSGVPDHLTAAASHLQGAPLIRVPRYQNKKNARRPFVTNPPTQTTQRPEAPSSDSCSVTSDEGLASGGSDTSLPRSVKPKRRNKKMPKEHGKKNLDLDDLIANQGDRLAELLRNSLSEPPPNESAPPPLWTSTEEVIWSSSSSSSGCWTSPVWSAGHSPSSSWPDKRVIRRPEGSSPSSDSNSWNWDGNQLQVSSQLIASPFNGHRDIEIRFFSAGPTSEATPTEPVAR